MHSSAFAKLKVISIYLGMSDDLVLILFLIEIPVRKQCRSGSTYLVRLLNTLGHRSVLDMQFQTRSNENISRYSHNQRSIPPVQEEE